MYGDMVGQSVDLWEDGSGVTPWLIKEQLVNWPVCTSNQKVLGYLHGWQA